jgi:KUP system potassium uptake protein
MSVSPEGIPGGLMHHYKLNKVLHQTVVLLSVLAEEIPRVARKERLRLESLGEGFYRLTARYGFMETPNVPELMKQAKELGLETEPMATTYVLGRETLLMTGKSGMSTWRKILFSMMSRNAMNPTIFFKLPPNQVIEIGAQIEV